MHKNIGVPQQNIVSATNGIDAYEQYVSKNFDFILMDLQMPIMCGYEASIKIKDYCSTNMIENPPIIVAISAFVNESVESQCQKSKIDYCTTSPLDCKWLETQVLSKMIIN